jgi:hypothetical protein
MVKENIGKKEKKERQSFGGDSWKVLQEIILNRDNGKLLRALRFRDNATNVQKALVWNNISTYYKEVGM